MIAFACPDCGKQVNVKEELAGKKGKCPDCGRALTVPARPPVREDGPPAEEATQAGEKKGFSTLTKVFTALFGAVIAPLVVAVGGKVADALLRPAPAAQAPPTAPVPGPPPEGGTREPEPPEPLPATYTNPLGMEFVLVPKGTAWLGGGGGKPGHKEVPIPQDFYLGKYEVTQEEWLKLMGNNPSEFSRTGRGKNAVKDVSDEDLKRFPVEQVGWDDAQRFLLELNKRDKQPGWVYRLPLEAEWEYACRGGPTTDKSEGAFSYYFDQPTNQLALNQANFSVPKDGLKRTCKVGSYTPNLRLGLFDMHGNVWEWCEDSTNGPNGSQFRVMRGGGWKAGAPDQRAGARMPTAPGHRANDHGLRVARVPADK